MKDKIKKSYNELGENYYQNRKNKSGYSYFYNECLEMPATLKILGPVKGKKILDLGCGPGIYARILTENGAKVKGIDNSQKMIEFAKKEAVKAEFILGDVEELPYKNNEFDIVLASLVIGHLEEWDNVFSEVKRVLKKKGIFIFSIHNPVTMVLKKKKWFFKKFYEIENYFNEGWKLTKWKGDGKVQEGAHHHKTYGTIIKKIIKNGFEIIDYQDAMPKKEAKEMFPRHYNLSINAPHFCVWKLIKK